MEALFFIVLVLASYAAGYATRGFIAREVKALGAEIATGHANLMSDLAKERTALLADLNNFFSKMRIGAPAASLVPQQIPAIQATRVPPAPAAATATHQETGKITAEVKA
jgi:hypothetical protein